MKRKTQKEFLLELNDKNPEVYTNDIYVNATTKLTFHCKNNENHIWMADPHHILLGRGCPLCARQKAYETRLKNNTKRNDEKLLCNHNPELLSCIKNKKDAEKYTYASHKEIEWICPDCHETFFKRISYMTRRGFICSKCATNDSYPNKFMMEILRQLNIDYIREYSPEWIKPKRYDFYFIYDNQKYIIEMDGAFHYVYNYKNNTSVSESQKIDRKKDEIANANGCHMIRINSNYRNVKSRLSYIKNNILNSELKLIFDLSNINWNRCEQYASTSLIKTINDLWNDGLSKSEIRQKIKLGKTTIDSYLEIGKRLGLSDYRPGIRHYISDDNKKYLKVQDKDNNILCVHLGISDFSRESTKLIGHKIGISQIYRYLKGSINNRKGLKFSYASKEEYIGFITNVS